MVKHVKTSKFVVGGSTGFITHEDQEVDGLSFNILFTYEGEDYVTVTGDEAKITAWVTRIEGVVVSQEDLDIVIALLPEIDPPIIP